jgi:hypothetical protein
MSRPNHPAAGNARLAFQLAIGRQGPGVPERGGGTLCVGRAFTS